MFLVLIKYNMASTEDRTLDKIGCDLTTLQYDVTTRLTISMTVEKETVPKQTRKAQVMVCFHSDSQCPIGWHLYQSICRKHVDCRPMKDKTGQRCWRH